MYFGMKAHIGAGAESGLVHTVRGTSGNVHDVTEGGSMLHGQEVVAFGDAGYHGIEKRPDAKAEVTWHAARQAPCAEPGQCSGCLDRQSREDQGRYPGHPFRVIKRCAIED